MRTDIHLWGDLNEKYIYGKDGRLQNAGFFD
jgi:hypothetical protein